MSRKRIAIINQRYGIEVNGGSEYYTRKLAEHLTDLYDIEVLTTTAMDYDTWKPYFKAGTETINGVPVRRFDVKRPRDVQRFKKLVEVMARLPKGLRNKLGNLWLKSQGPYCPDLIEYIKAHVGEYEVFIFVTYLYFSTVKGIVQCPEKSILVPTAHDEFGIYFPIYRDVFLRPRGIVYLTEAEKGFVENLFDVSSKSHVVAGSGIELPAKIDVEPVLRKYGIKDDYLIYVGRIDTGKKFGELLQFFQQYKRENPNPLNLVAVGKKMMETPSYTDVLYLGYIEEEDKYSLMAGARVLILPSQHESLSLAVLESMALGVPVLVNGQCEVLKKHCEKSGAGFYYMDYDDFRQYLNKLLREPDTWKNMSCLGRKYVAREYSWRKTVEQYRTLIEG